MSEGFFYLTLPTQTPKQQNQPSIEILKNINQNKPLSSEGDRLEYFGTVMKIKYKNR